MTIYQKTRIHLVSTRLKLDNDSLYGFVQLNKRYHPKLNVLQKESKTVLSCL